MVINDCRVHVGNRPLTITRNGDTIIVRTGNIPRNLIQSYYKVYLCYSSWCRNLRRRRARGRRRFIARSEAGTSLQANSTYTFTLSRPRKWGRKRDTGYFSIRAEIRDSNGWKRNGVYYSNIIYITIQ
jgi:hypothetical protein